MKKLETSILNELDGVICLSNEDLATYQTFAPITKMTSIPIGFNESLLNNYNHKKQFEKEPIIYHLGSMDWRPNIQGVTWFLQEVLPFLNQIQPNLDIRLAGKKMPKSFYKNKAINIQIDGEVENAIQYQEDKSILIVPLLAGSGIRVKIIEALALGKSIVSTTIGAQGIDYSDGENMLIADNPKSFAEAIIRCVNSTELRKKLGENSIKLSKKNYSISAVGNQKINHYGLKDP